MIHRYTRTRTYTEKVTATRRFEFDAGHRVLGHEGKCRHIHGHRYVAEVTVVARQLNDLGMVIDFSVLKDEVGKWIEDNWDHNFICNYADPILDAGNNQELIFGGRAPAIMDCNPTAENMAKGLFKIADMLIGHYHIKVIHVRLYETPNCFADYSQEEET